MDGWMDGLFFFLSFIHTHSSTLPLIKLVERSKLFQALLCLFSFSLSLSRVCQSIIIDRSRGGTGNVGDLSNLPAGMLLVATRVCVCVRAARKCGSPFVCVCIFSLFIFRNHFRIPFCFVFVFLLLVRAHLFYVNCCGRAKWHSS